MEPIHDLDELTVDNLEMLVIALQDLDELWGGGEELLWDDGADKGLRRAGHLCDVRSIMRCP